MVTTLDGFEISEIHRNANWCTQIDKYGWTYSKALFDEDTGETQSMTGPQGQQWVFVTISEF